MNTEKDNGYSFNSPSVLLFIIKHRRILIIVSVIAMVVSTIISFLIEPRYKSSVVMFPASSVSISRSLLTDNSTEKDILKFGEEEDVEQMLQVLYSDQIRDRVIKKYNLMKHYGIDSTDSYPLTSLYEKFDQNITFRRTEYLSVKVEVLDINADTAALIANDIAALLDSTINRMQKERAKKAFLIVEKEYITLQNEIRDLEDSITKIRAMGISDYESQTEVFNDAYAQAIAMGRIDGAKKLEDKLNVIAKYGGAYVSIRDLLMYEVKKLSELQSKYAQAKVDLEQDLPHKFIVDNAYRAEKRSSPIRWLIVLLSMLSTFILTMFLLLFIESYKKQIKFNKYGKLF